MFWNLLVTRVVRARSYETIHIIGTHCVRTYRVYSWGNELSLGAIRGSENWREKTLFAWINWQGVCRTLFDARFGWFCLTKPSSALYLVRKATTEFWSICYAMTPTSTAYNSWTTLNLIFYYVNIIIVTRSSKMSRNSLILNFRQSERSVHRHAVIPLFRLSQQSFWPDAKHE